MKPLKNNKLKHMKKYIFKFVLLFFIYHNFSYGQFILKNDSDIKWYKSMHQERVFVHYNTSLLFTGEYLYYKFYCLNSTTNNLSNTSKIGYVELLGENGESIFKHKVKLEKGLGQGDFFVPTSIPSGNYKLLAYTQWMRNGEGNNFFSSDISIINPYKGDQSVVLPEISNTENNIKYEAKNNDNFLNTNQALKEKIMISLNSKSFGHRSKVLVAIKSLYGKRSFGNYSISVRKIDTILTPSMYTSINYTQLFRNAKSKNRAIGDNIYMPEFKGEMITGRIINKETKQPVAKKDIALSIINNESILDITTTNEDGIFYFHLNVNYNGDDTILQVIDKHPEKYEIKLNEHASISSKNLKFNQFKISSKMRQFILERSINNQIQNGYFSVKPDTIKTAEPEAPFYGNHQDIYNLDDYTRFPTVDETVVEIIEHAWTRKTKSGKKVLIVRGREFDPYFGSELLPLVLVDGIFIQNHESIIMYEAKKIESISVLRDEYYYGSQIYKGIISIKTIKGEYHKELNENYSSNVKLFKPLPIKNYFNQTYDITNEIESSRTPDFRQQLLWMPRFILDSNEKEIAFFTSDSKGTYEIALEGFTNQGVPISVRKIIDVNN